MGYTIGQTAKKTGLSTHTLRYYEKEGLLPFVKKSASGLRIFSDTDLGWLSMIECLKETGMSLKNIRQYINWFIEGDLTLDKRLAMFEKQKSNIEAQIELYQKHLKRIEYKIKLYRKAVELGSLDKALADTDVKNTSL